MTDTDWPGGGRSTLDGLLELLPLGDLPRTGWVLRGVRDPERIAAHVLGVCDVVLALGPHVQPELDVDRALALALVHDAPEALTGDLPRVAADLLPKGAKREAEARAAERLFAGNPLALERYAEYCDRRTREARFVALCDRLQLGVRLVAYRRAGVGGLDEFRDGLEGLRCDEFAPAAELQRQLLDALDELGGR